MICLALVWSNSAVQGVILIFFGRLPLSTADVVLVNFLGFFLSFFQNFKKIRYFFSISSKNFDMYLILGTRNGIGLMEKDGMGLKTDPSLFLFAVPCTKHILIKTTLQTRYLLLILYFTNISYLYNSVLRYFKE